MPQVLKEEIREKIRTTALSVFAEKGFEKSSISDIAEKASVSTGNIYRYFPDKETLFREALPEKIILSIVESVRKKITSWNGLPLDSDGSSFRKAHEELIRPILEKRLEWMVILRYAEGTFYQNISEEMTGLFLEFFSKYLNSIGLGKKMENPDFKGAIRQIYKNIIKAFGDILSSEADEQLVRNSLLIYMDYHIAGIRQLSR